MYTNIVVPFDKSEHAERALKAAVELGRGDGPAKVTVLNVTDMMDFDDATFEVAARMAGVPPISDEAAHLAREKYFDEHKDEIRQCVDGVVAGKVPENVTLDVDVVGGHPQEAIRDYVRGKDFDCIVMGRRGLGAIRGAIGSVSYSVLRSVDLPVLIVK